MKEPGIVVIVDEDAEGIDIFEVLSLSIIPVANVVHRGMTSKYVANRIVHRVIKQCSDVVLIGTDVSWIAVKAFTHLENASRCSVFTPKVLRYLWNSVYTDSIKLVFSHDILDPVF